MYHLFFGAGAGSPGSDMTVFDIPRAAPERRGNNSITRTQFRVDGEATLAWWAERFDSLGVSHGPIVERDGRLDDAGYRNSGLVDRHYFTSIYVREPNHVLFELATDGPGFEVDGPLDGEHLSLPPFLEPRRAEIEAHLRPLESTAATDRVEA